MTTAVLVDTNVALAANGMSSVPEDCAVACVAALLAVTRGERRLVLDEGYEIVGEYLHKLQPKGQRGVGDAFAKWVATNWSNPAFCDLVAIELDDDGEYVSFPRTGGLANFDRSDRKFVAVAAAHGGHPPILEAADSKWWGWQGALREVGLDVDFLCDACAEYLRTTYIKKMG